MNLFHGFLTTHQVEGINAVLDAWPDGVDPRIGAYGLATAWWETDFTFQPVDEIGHGKGRFYGKPTGPFGQIYYGRGYVQLTLITNYIRADNELRAAGLLKPGESLIKTPDLAMRPDLAAFIMVRGMTEGWFGPPIGQFFTPTRTDFVQARRNINVMDHAYDIAHAAHHFYTALQLT